MEFKTDEELIKAYAELRVKELVYKGDEREFNEILKELKQEYYTFAKKENKTSTELWLDDAKKCYLELKSELDEYLVEQERLNTIDHIKYNIPLDLYKASKNDFGKGKVEEAVKIGNLLIKGKSDYGKSHLAVAIMREHLEQNPNMKIEMFFEDEFHDMSYEESQAEMKRLKKLDGIVFDDLGAIGLGVDKRNLIKGLIYSLFRNGKLCIICSNCSIEELYDTRTASKIIGGCTIVNKSNTGTRLKNKKEITI